MHTTIEEQLSIVEKIRNDQITNTVIPFYLSAGLHITKLISQNENLLFSRAEAYSLHKMNGNKLSSGRILSDLYGRLTLGGPPKDFFTGKLTSKDFALKITVNGKLITTLQCEVEEFTTQTKINKLWMELTHTYIHADKRIEILKSALPHIILSGE